MKIGRLPQAEEEKNPADPEPELVPGSAEFRKHLEALAGINGGGGGAEEEEMVLSLKDAPAVRFRRSMNGGEDSSDPADESNEILAAIEAEGGLNEIESVEALLDEPSIVELYRQRLVEHFGFATDDPVFALCEIFDEVRRRDLEKSAASERFLSELTGKAERALAGLEERSATLEGCLKEERSLETSLGKLGKLVERIEEALMATKEEAAAQAAILSVVQRELEDGVRCALQRRWVERFLMWAILVGVIGVVLLVCHLVLSLG